MIGRTQVSAITSQMKQLGMKPGSGTRVPEPGCSHPRGRGRQVPRAWAWAVRAQAEPSGCRGEQAHGMGTQKAHGRGPLLEGRRRLCHARPEAEPRFPDPEPPPTPRPQHRPRAPAAGPRAAPSPAIGCAFGSRSHVAPLGQVAPLSLRFTGPSTASGRPQGRGARRAAPGAEPLAGRLGIGRGREGAGPAPEKTARAQPGCSPSPEPELV